MKLAEICATLAPYLEGEIDRDATARRLWGSATGDDARRLSIYQRAARGHRRDALDSVFTWTRAAIGDDAWSPFVEDYFRASPMRHAELRENGASFPSFLGTCTALWIAELADLEWHLWRAEVAVDEDSDDDRLHVASTVVHRTYAHDLIAHVRKEEAPALRRDIVVLLWRDRDLDARMDYVTADGLRILERIRAGESVAASAAFESFCSEGIVLGSVKAPSRP